MYNTSYLVLVLVTMVIGLCASGYVNGILKKYSKVQNSRGVTGASVTQQMLRHYGVRLNGVNAGGTGEDFFDPRNNTITLSPDSYRATSITALATACHETGHACQYAENYTPMKIRSAIVPAVNFCSNAWVFVLMIGMVANMLPVVWFSIILYAGVVLFQLVTLPVEFNASNRALAYMNTIGLPDTEQKACAKVLRACALTYVAAALTSVLQLLWLLGKVDNNDR